MQRKISVILGRRLAICGLMMSATFAPSLMAPLAAQEAASAPPVAVTDARENVVSGEETRPGYPEETRVAPEGHTPPPATLSDMAWLEGRWSGNGVEGAAAYESWQRTGSGPMVGMFVQENADGGIMFSEILYLMEEEGSLVLRLKHFGPRLKGWEDKDEMLSFSLVAMEDGAAYFNGLTLRPDGADGFVAAVRMNGEGGESSELVFPFTRPQSTGPLPR